MASSANSLPGDYVQEQASLQNDCPESVEQQLELEWLDQYKTCLLECNEFE